MLIKSNQLVFKLLGQNVYKKFISMLNSKIFVNLKLMKLQKNLFPQPILQGFLPSNYSLIKTEKFWHQ